MWSDEIKQALNSLFDYIAGYMSLINVGYILLAASILIILLIILHIRNKKRYRIIKERSAAVDELLKNFRLSRGFENNLNGILGAVSAIFACPGYSLYIFDEKKNEYILKAVKHTDTEEGQVGPSYSGLLPFKKETYLPPLSVSPDPVPEKTTQVKAGTVPLLVVPVKKVKALIYIGPIRKVSPKTKGALDNVAEKLGTLLEILMDNEKLKKQVEVVVASGKAMSSISDIMMDDEGILSTIMGISVKTIGADGGFFVKQDGERTSIVASVGMKQKLEHYLTSDHHSHAVLCELAEGRDVTLVHNDDKEYFKLPSIFAAEGIEMLALVNVSTSNSSDVAGFWFNDAVEIEQYRLTALVLMSRRMGDIIQNRSRIKELSNSYIDMLKMLAQMTDNINPHTVGYSELMYRYAYIIAMEMNLSRQEAEEIGIAAYLSNIGVLGLSNDLFNKKGKYTEVEYEMMKLHADVGASLIEATVGNSRLASYVRHHHERMDGYGYPAGLKGEEIPLGARIIAVAQTFLAKLIGRKDRDPLPYAKAVELIKASAGAQLDSEAVEALLRWFKRKQGSCTRPEFSLGPCWEMRCCPESICSQCPAYKRTDKNCWEFSGIKCSAHGNKCDTCVVYTEFISRNSIKAPTHQEG
jgi:HD-GYP domain-containing protein (c-di-GMP phosphodiesterase class II)